MWFQLVAILFIGIVIGAALYSAWQEKCRPWDIPPRQAIHNFVLVERLERGAGDAMDRELGQFLAPKETRQNQ